MPQTQLPIFPDSCTLITPELAFQRRDGRVFYFNGHLPVFSHAPEDIASFRLIVSQLIDNGSASQAQICRAFGIPSITVKRICKTLRERGSAGFFSPKPRATGSKLTPALLAQAQLMLNDGSSVPEISAAMSVLQTTLHKAISDGRLKKTPSPAL